MECVIPSFSDDFWAVNGDDFFIDDLLDSPVNEAKTTIPETELRLPVNDVDDLEWMSQFTNDSFSGDYSLTYPAGKLPVTETETVTLVAVNPTFKNSANKRTRSKRSRAAAGVWSRRSSAPLTESSTSSSSISSKPPERKRAAAMGGSARLSQSQARRCSHCLVQKTPQWRAGPLGAKTLCNACGVRFKSGRLLPEYRPARSPTYSAEVHSNNHRKVLEMQRKRPHAAV